VTTSDAIKTYQLESTQERFAKVLTDGFPPESKVMVLAKRYTTYNDRPSVRIDYKFTKDGVNITGALMLMFVEERKFVVSFAAVAEIAQAEKWNKTSEEAIRSFTLLSDKQPPAIESYGKGVVVQASPLYVGERVLNYDATSLPKPVYPPAALAIRASGVVTVKVTVDEKGDVTSATAESGHPLLQRACEKAALQAKFKPSVASAGKLTGIIIYNFVAPPLSKTKDN
jgi:TonB family protein